MDNYLVPHGHLMHVDPKLYTKCAPLGFKQIVGEIKCFWGGNFLGKISQLFEGEIKGCVSKTLR